MKKQEPSTPEKAEEFDASVTSERYKRWFPDLNKLEIERLVIYTGELLKFNRTVNLISPTTVKNAESVHIGDAVLASKLIGPALLGQDPVYDFGSGNGIPGIIFASLFSERSVILIDRDQRKMEFCKHVIAAMGLSNVTIKVEGIESLKAGSVRNAMARGFAPLSKSLLAARKQFPRGGRFLHLKSDGWANELASLPSQLFTHWSPSLLGKYRLPESTTELFVVLTEKTAD